MNYFCVVFITDCTYCVHVCTLLYRAAAVYLQKVQALESTPFAAMGHCEGGRTALWCAYKGKRTTVTKVTIWGTNARVDATGTRYWNCQSSETM